MWDFQFFLAIFLRQNIQFQIIFKEMVKKGAELLLLTMRTSEVMQKILLWHNIRYFNASYIFLQAFAALNDV